MSEALVLFYRSQSVLFFQTKLDVIQGFVRKADQIRSDCKRELSECDFPIRLVTQTTQDGIDVLFQNFLLELEEVILDVFKIKEAEVALIDDTEDRYSVEFLHCFKGFLLNFDLDVIVNFLFEETGQFKLHIGLKSVVSSDLVVLPLGHFSPQCDVIHGQYHLQEAMKRIQFSK